MKTCPLSIFTSLLNIKSRLKHPNSFRHSRAAFFCAVPFAALFAVSASAANISWTGATDGVWSTGGDWTGGVAPAAADVAVFDAGSTANLKTTLGANFSIQGLRIMTPGGLITIGAGNTLTLGSGGIDMSSASQDLLINALLALAADQTWNVGAGRTLTVNSAISGTGVNLSKIGLGVLTLAGANTFTGTTTIGGGTLNLSGSLNGTTGTDLTFTGTGIFNVTAAAGANQGMGVLRFNIGDGVVKSTNNGGTSGVSFASRAARAAGATGNFVLSGGTPGTPGSPGTLGTNNIVIGGGELTGQLLDRGLFYNGSRYAAYDAGGFVRGLIYGTDLNAPASILAGATLGVNDATKDVQISGDITAQTTAVVNTISDPGAFSITLTGGQTLSINGFLKSGASAATISGGNGITTTVAGYEMVIRTDAAGDTLTISTPILDNGGSSFTKSGAGTLFLTTASTYTGGTTLGGGSLILSNKNGFGTGTVTLAGGTNFKTGTFEGNTAGGALLNAFLLSGGNATLDVSFGTAKDIWINTPVSGPGGFIVIGSGRAQGLTLSGAKTFSGGVTLGTPTLPTDTPNVSIDDNASLGTGVLRSELNASSVTDGALRINTSLSNVANPIVIASGARIVIQTLNNNVTLNGVISDEGNGGALITAGTGIVTLGNANTFKGTTTIASGGTVLLGNSLALQNSTLSYSTGTLGFGTLTSSTLGGITGSQGLALTNALSQAVALTVGNNNTNTTYAGSFTDGAAAGGSFTKNGTGTFTLGNNSALNQTGATNINGGTLLFSSAAPDVPTSAINVNSGGTLGITTNTLTLHNTLTFSGTSAYQLQTGATLNGSTVINGNLNVTGTPVLRLASDGTTPSAGTKVIATYTGTLLNSAAWTVDALSLNSSGSQLSNWIAGNGTWVTPANWDQLGWGGSVFYDTANKQLKLTGFTQGNIAPLSTTIATIAPANNAAVTAPATTTTVASLTIGNSGAFSHSLTLQPGAPLKVNGALTLNPSGTLNASAASFLTNTLNMSGGTVTLGTGSSAGIANLTSGTLAATIGNEMTVSSKLITGTTSIFAGNTPFKVSGSNLVSGIDGLMIQGGTTKFANATYGSISLTDAGAVWSTNNGNPISNPFTTSPTANALVVHVNWRATNINAKTQPPVLTYNGVTLTQASSAYDAGAGNWANTAVYYLYNPTQGSNPLAVSFQQGGITDYAVDAFTLGGADTTFFPETRGATAGILPLDNRTTTSLTLNNIPLHGVATSSVIYRTTSGIPTSLVGSVSSGEYGTLITSGPGGGNGLQWKANAATSPTIVGAGMLVTDVTSSSLTSAATSDLISARFGMASAAFAPVTTLFPINRPAMTVDVTSANTLDFGGAPSVSMGAMTLQPGSSLTLSNAPGTVTFSSISGSGSLTQAGSGTLVLSGVSSYVGAATISAGTLSIGADANLGNANLLIFNGGTLQITGTALTSYAGGVIGSHPVTMLFDKTAGFDISDAGNTFTVNQTLSQGSGGLTKLGAGKLVLGGTNTFTGAVTLSAGTLSVGTNANLGNGNTLVFNGGTLQITGTALNSYAAGVIGAHAVTLTPDKTVGFDIASAANTFIVGQILNQGAGGLTKAGPGTLILGGANTYTGTTTVNGGMLVVNGTISGTTTVSGGTLAGDNGILGNVTANNGGTLSPGGGGIGALTVNGDINLNGSSIFSVQFDSTAIAVDGVALNGNLNIASGAVLNVSDIGSNPSSIFGVTAPVITYSGTWNGGTFAGLPDDSYFMSAGQAYQISYDRGAVTLTMLAVIPEPGTAASLLGGLGLLLGVRRRRFTGK